MLLASNTFPGGFVMKQGLVLFCVFVFAQFLFAIPANVVPNLQSPRPEVYTSGQPTNEGFEQLADQGIKSVINVLPEKYCVRDEAQIVMANGMTYRTIPFNTSSFRKETVEQFADILRTVKKPVLIHCSTGNHVGGMWFSYLYLIENRKLEEALMEARMIGLRPKLEKDLVSWAVEQK
jgi:uncharacterized protein (TIGR01244 family)